MNFNTHEKGGNKIRIGAVSYLNTKPLVYGLEKGLMKDEVELLYDHPAKIAQYLLDNTIDVGLVPVSIIPGMKEYHLVADYGIAADGQVASVCLFSEVPLNQITTVLLDYQSRTSVMLVQYLLKEYWQHNPAFKKAGIDFINEIKRGKRKLRPIDKNIRKGKKMDILDNIMYDLRIKIGKRRKHLEIIHEETDLY